MRYLFNIGRNRRKTRGTDICRFLKKGANFLSFSFLKLLMVTNVLKLERKRERGGDESGVERGD